MMRDATGKRGLNDLIEYLRTKVDHPLNMVELGSYAGESSKIFADSGFVNRIFCIDPWCSITGNGNGNDYDGNEMRRIEAEFDRRTGGDGRIVKCKGILTDYLDYDFGGKVDFVYIDAIHTYDACKEDIINTVRYLNPTFIGGHDYTTSVPHVIGVKIAVDEIFKNPDATFCDTSWIKKI